MDEKGARIACPAGEEVVVPVGIKEMYVGVPQNRLSVTVIECISADGRAIPPLIIIPGVLITESWFHEKMTGHELVTVSASGYTNEGICLTWLHHFIKHNNCGPEKEWHILLIDGATCHKADEFILTAKMNKIWVVKFPSHQTHLIQPCDVGCFREWKHYQQCALMNAIRSYEAEYLVSSFFRDLPTIREKTFTVSTIKHAFQKSGIWPVSFKAVKKKLKEYGKKSKKDTGLNLLEFGSELESEAEDEAVAKPMPMLIEEYQLP
jgi:DDE superfamily endonuclease